MKVLWGRGHSPVSNFFCRTIQWHIDRRDWWVFPAPDWNIPSWRSEITTECQSQWPERDWLGGKDSQKGALAKGAGKIQPPTLLFHLQNFSQASVLFWGSAETAASIFPSTYGRKERVWIWVERGGGQCDLSRRFKGKKMGTRKKKKKENGDKEGSGRTTSLTLLFLEIILPTSKPELWAETNFPLAPWKNLTLWCRSSSGSTKEFVLLKDGTAWIATRPASEHVRAAFPLGALTQNHTGSYHCHSWEEMAVSEPSEALELVGTGKKSLRALPV